VFGTKTNLGRALILAAVLAGPAAAQPAPERSTTTLEEIRRIDDEMRARRQAFQAQVQAVDRMLEDMKRMIFEIDLRIAKIRAGKFERDCAGATDELAVLAGSLEIFRKTWADTEAMCAGDDDPAVTGLCADRRRELADRRAELSAKTAAIAEACPAAAPKETR
jgi:hypothetical protein